MVAKQAIRWGSLQLWELCFFQAVTLCIAITPTLVIYAQFSCLEYSRRFLHRFLR